MHVFLATLGVQTIESSAISTFVRASLFEGNASLGTANIFLIVFDANCIFKCVAYCFVV